MLFFRSKNEPLPWLWMRMMISEHTGHWVAASKLEGNERVLEEGTACCWTAGKSQNFSFQFLSGCFPDFNSFEKQETTLCLKNILENLLNISQCQPIGSWCCQWCYWFGAWRRSPSARCGWCPCGVSGRLRWSWPTSRQTPRCNWPGHQRVASTRMYLQCSIVR